MLPNFLMIGATKCGTSSVFRYLRTHPEVFLHPRKELRFFTTEHRFANGTAWYEAQFAAAEGYRAVGEASNAYTRDPVYGGVPERIRALIPDAKLVYLIRHPLRRIESHYRHRLVTGIEWREPTEAISADPRYLAATKYGHQVHRYAQVFPREQICVLHLEELIADPPAQLARLCAFLEIADMPDLVFEARNVTAERRVAPAPVRLLGGHLKLPPRRIKRLTKLVRDIGLARWLDAADEPDFDLAPSLRQRIRDALESDRQLLARSLDVAPPAWDLDLWDRRDGSRGRAPDRHRSGDEAG